MDLSKKTTILLTPEMHRQLVRLARQRDSSIGALVRDAVAECYGLQDPESRLAAVAELAELSLPVADVRTMVEESVPAPRAVP